MPPTPRARPHPSDREGLHHLKNLPVTFGVLFAPLPPPKAAKSAGHQQLAAPRVARNQHRAGAYHGRGRFHAGPRQRRERRVRGAAGRTSWNGRRFRADLRRYTVARSACRRHPAGYARNLGRRLNTLRCLNVALPRLPAPLRRASPVPWSGAPPHAATGASAPSPPSPSRLCVRLRLLHAGAGGSRPAGGLECRVLDPQPCAQHQQVQH